MPFEPGVKFANSSSMGKVVRRLFIGLGAIVGLLVLMVVGIALFFDVNHYKPQIETAVAKSTGMNLKIAGKASLKVFPQIRIALNRKDA